MGVADDESKWWSLEIQGVVFVGALFLSLVCLRYSIRVIRSFFSKPAAAGFVASSEDADLKTKFIAFQKRYVIVSSLAYCVDLVAGPYVYFMFSDLHGLKDEQIRELTQIPYVAAALACCFLPPLVDTFGRRLGLALSMACYALRYLLVCFSGQHSLLVLAQIAYGVGVSLLGTAPDAWMVDQHRIFRFPERWLQKTYSLSGVTSALCAIVACLLARWIREWLGLRVVLYIGSGASLVTIGLLFLLWDENVGGSLLVEESSENRANLGSRLISLFVGALTNALTRFQIFFVGITQAAFSGAQWLFVALWTPLLNSRSPDTIFIGFMICSGLGSYIATIGINSIDPNRSTIPPTRSLEAEPEDVQAPRSFTLGVAGGGTLAAGVEVVAEAGAGVAVAESGGWQEASLYVPDATASESRVSMFFSRVRKNGFPLRGAIVAYQALAAFSFLWMRQGKSRWEFLAACFLFEVCFGIHLVSFVNLRAQVLPSKGRVITMSLFEIPTSLINFFTVPLYLDWPTSQIISLGMYYCSAACLLTCIAWTAEALRQRRRPIWDPKNPNIAYSPEESTKTDWTKNFTSPSIFFSRRQNNSQRQNESHSNNSPSSDQQTAEVLTPLTPLATSKSIAEYYGAASRTASRTATINETSRKASIGESSRIGESRIGESPKTRNGGAQSSAK